MKNPTGLLAASLLLGLAPATAMAHDYTYVDGGLVESDRADTGSRMSGSFEVSNPISLFGEIEGGDGYSRIGGGALFRAALGPQVDFNAGGSVESVDSGQEEDVGLGIRAGVRWQVTPEPHRFELSPEIRQLHVFDTVDTSLRINTLFRVAQPLDLLGVMQAGDDDRIELGVRYNFRPAAQGY